MHIYKSCSELPISRFYKVVETSNYAYLIKEYQGKEIKTKEDLVGVWESIYTEYCDLTNDNSSLMMFKLKGRCAVAELKLFVVGNLCIQMTLRSDMQSDIFERYVNALKSWGFTYDGYKYDPDQMDNVQRQIRGLKGEISLLKSKLEDFKSSEPVPFMKQVVMVEQALGRNSINPDEVTVEKWVYMMDAIRDMNAQRNKSMRNVKL